MAKIDGTNGDDILLGTEDKDDINGNDGNDYIQGLGEKDKINGEDGDDTLSGGDGDDDIKGGKDNDIIYGDAGDDKLKGEDGDDTIEGGEGDDDIDGGKGFDIAVYSGSFFEYDIIAKSGGDLKTTVTDLVADRDGVDNLKKVELLRFSDGDIYLDGTNNAAITQDDVAATDEESPIVFNPVANDFDYEGHTLTITAIAGMAILPGGFVDLAEGRVSLGPDGQTLTFDPDGDFEELSVGDTQAVVFDYTVTDSLGASSDGTVTVEVSGVNDEPVAQDDAFATDEDTPIAGNVLADNGGGADSDIDANDTLTVTEVNGQAADVGTQITLPSGALLTLNADGSFDYDPNDAFEALNDGESDIDSFTYTVDDGNGGTDTATVTIDIDGVTDVFPPPIPGGQVWVFDENNDLLAVYSTSAGTDPNGNPIIVNAFPINAAVAGAHAGVDHTVAVGAGSYVTGSSAITITHDGMKLYGNQWGVDPREAAGLRTVGSGDESVINGTGAPQVFKVQADNVEVNGFEFFGAGGDLLVTDGITGTGGDSGFVGSYNILHGAGDDGFSIYKHTGAIVEYNLIFATQDGIEIRGTNNGTEALIEGFDNIVRFNEIDGGFGNGGIYAFGAENTTITENYVHDYAGDSGIVMGTRRGTGNHFENGGEVSNNVVERSGENGIDVFQSDVLVTGNTVTENNGWAVSIGIDYNNETRDATKPDNVTVTDNVFEGNNLVKNAPVTTAPGSTPAAGPVRIVNGSTNITVDDNDLIGNGNANLLGATSGDDFMDGLTGFDTYLFRADYTGDGILSVDTVAYVDGEDMINLGGATVASFDEGTPGQVTLTLDGADGDQIVVAGVSAFADIDFV